MLLRQGTLTTSGACWKIKVIIISTGLQESTEELPTIAVFHVYGTVALLVTAKRYEKQH